LKVGFKRLVENAIMPSYNHETDSGMDFYALEDGVVLSQSRKLVGTGIAWEPELITIPIFKTQAVQSDLIDDISWWANENGSTFKTLLKLEGRSGLGIKGIDILGGVVDQDYRGEIKAILFNTDTERALEYKRGDRIAQGIIHLIPTVEIIEITDMSDTERGASGFGKSGS
jgi:dUTP pyrophosphatase